MEDGGVIPVGLHTDLLAGGGSRERSSAGLGAGDPFPASHFQPVISKRPGECISHLALTPGPPSCLSYL